jgi:hypothetical protein
MLRRILIFLRSKDYNVKVPLRAAATKEASKPFLLIVRIALPDTFNCTQTPSDSKKNFFV